MKIGQELYFQEGVVPSILSGRQFVITDVNTYNFVNSSNQVFTLSGDSVPPLFLSNFGEVLSISRALTIQELGILFNINELTGALSEGRASVERRGLLKGWEDWFDSRYLGNLPYKVGVYYSGSRIANREGKRLVFYTLTGECGSIDIEMFEGCEVFFYVTIYQKLDVLFLGIG